MMMMSETLTPPSLLNLRQMNLSTGKKTRLHRLMYSNGPGSGKLMVLPIDQGLEHGPVDFFDEHNGVMGCADPEFQFQLAQKGRFSAIATHIGLAERYYPSYAGRVPLVLKLNGKTCIPNDDNAFSPLTSTVEDAVRLGADAVGYTLFVGSPAQDRDIRQFMEVRRDCERFGMPIIMWAYPRGEDVNKVGGKNSLYAVDYAARVAAELGADVVKVNYPETSDSKRSSYPAPYNDLHLDNLEAARKVVQSAGKTLVIFSGGSRVSHDELYGNVHTAFKSGAVGLIFGRNMWQRPMEEAIEISENVREIFKGY
jgi:fructose-bisphosphate aldolase, class I